MQEIKMNDKTIGYASNPKDVKNFLPEGAPSKFEMLGSGNDRRLIYGDDVYTIFKSSKKVGIEINDICPVCNLGNVFDFGGCHSCDNCSTQLKCGL